jgi:ubiquinone/menaquinone biosynthesis C-methylase UbiE
MSYLLDHRYLEHEQYKDASHLNAHIQLHQRFSTNPYGWFKLVFDQLDLSPEVNILEIGCGPGTLWSENKDRIPVGWRITLSNFSPGMVRETNRNIGINQNSFTFEVSNGMAIPFSNESFYVIIANHVLPHFPDRQTVLSEISRVLKPDGRFFASTIGENHLVELSQIMDRCDQSAGNQYPSTFGAGEFTLENGTQQIVPWFKQLEIRRYNDALVITETKPLVAYSLSMLPREDIIPDDRFTANLSRSIDGLIEQHGAIYIQKSTGLFIGKKGINDE